jgi:DUF4097 and DUF4098 domain-containing protein YvlB
MGVRQEHWSVGERPSVDLRVPSGSVEVRNGAAGQVELSLDSSSADEFEVSAVGDMIVVRHPSRWTMRGRSCRLVLTVPAGSDVAAETASAEVRMSGTFGAVRVRTASGDIAVGDSLRLELSTASGDITIGSVLADARLTAISGDCTAQTVGGRLEATLTSGDLRVERCNGDVHVASTSGSARIAHCGGGDIELRSMSGDLRVGLPSGIRVAADLSTISGKASLPEPAPAGSSPDQRRPVRLRLKTVSGDLRVERCD